MKMSLNTEGENWISWLDSHKSFAFQGQQGRLSVQKETRPRSQEGYWYAYQRQGKRMVKQYLGRTSEVTMARLENAVHTLALRASTDQIPQTNNNSVESSSPGPATVSLAVTPSVSTWPAEVVLPAVEPMLEPKLRLPRLHNFLVTRSRLLDRLDESLDRKLTLISALPVLQNYSGPPLVSRAFRDIPNCSCSAQIAGYHSMRVITIPSGSGATLSPLANWLTLVPARRLWSNWLYHPNHLITRYLCRQSSLPFSMN